MDINFSYSFAQVCRSAGAQNQHQLKMFNGKIKLFYTEESKEPQRGDISIEKSRGVIKSLREAAYWVLIGYSVSDE